VLLSILLVAACGDRKDQGTAPVQPASSAASAALSASPRSPFFVTLEAGDPVSFSGLEGGVWIVDASRRRYASAAGGADLQARPMPEGLPAGTGGVLRVAGRLPDSVWLSFEELGADGKVRAAPLYKLRPDGGLSLVDDDWRLLLAAWSRDRVLATSMHQIKFEVVDPPRPHEPSSDLPSGRLEHLGCNKTVQVRQMVALRTGEVIIAADCTPSPARNLWRYVMIRWGAPPASTPAPAPTAAASESTVGVPSTLDWIDGVPAPLTHRALFARSAGDIYAAAVEGEDKGAIRNHLIHFDGKAWSEVELPETPEAIRDLSGTSDGTIWLLTDHAIWKRSPAGSWSSVPPPARALVEPLAVWTFSNVWGAGNDVWVAARHGVAERQQGVVLRLQQPKTVIQWK
jgi:hypothetical protein